MTRVVMATRSAGKVRELRALLEQAGLTPVTLEALGVHPNPDEDAIEQLETFEDNARAKAAYYAARCDGLPVVAEDSGLCVDALHGAPGVHSKRWSGGDDAHNVQHLLHQLRDVADTARGAQYVCVAVWHDVSGVREARGVTQGRISRAPCGTGGFGYDPVFWSTELHACFGAVAAEEKARVSHRARAVQALLTGAPVDPRREAQ
jgi:XTP/dITP diphosphohydrolase